MKKLYRNFLSETARIEHCYNYCVSQYDLLNCSFQQLPLEGLVIRIHDTWVRFCKELLFVSTLKRPIGLSGAQIPCVSGLSCHSDIIDKLKLSYSRGKPPWWEPRWGNASEFLNAARTIGVTNFLNLSAGIGHPDSPIENLRIVRNYIAHRGRKTSKAYDEITTTYGFSQRCDIFFFLTQPVPPGISVFVDWVRTMQLMAEISMQ